MDYNEDGEVCTGITMITKDISHHGVAVPKNRSRHYLVYNFLATLFLCCFIFSYKDIIVSQCQDGGLVNFKGRQPSRQTTICGLLLTKTVTMNLHFECVLLIIRTIIWGRNGLLFLFWDCLNVMSFLSWEIYLKFVLCKYLVHITSILDYYLRLGVMWIP